MRRDAAARPMLRTTSAILLATCLAAAQAGPAEFEEPETPALSELLPLEFRQSVHHTVEEVSVDGRFYSFRLDSEFGTYSAPSLALLRVRVREIETLSQAVNQLAAQGDEPAQEARGQYSVSADSALDILTHPVSTAGDLAGQVAGNLNETLTGVPATAMEEQPAWRGVEQARDPVLAMHRRNAAAQWGLDPYSSNARVQEFLGAVARARSGGRIASGAPTFFAPTQRNLSVQDANIDGGVAGALKSGDPEQLRAENMEMLAGMQLRADLAGRFLDHPAFSPRHQTRITRYLRALDGVLNRGAFVEAALNAGDERMAMAFEEAAMMLVHYHRGVARLQKLHAGTNLLQALTVDNRIVYFAPVDVVYWSRPTAELFDQQVQRDRAAGFRGWELVVAGRVTPGATRELAQREYAVRDFYVR
jgi:hypothetical protein